MAKTIYLPDGSMYAIFDQQDFICLVEDKLGRDGRLYVEKLIHQADAAYQKAQTDCDSYEASLEDNRAAFQELLDWIAALELLLVAPRVNKMKALEDLQQMRTTINNQI